MDPANREAAEKCRSLARKYLAEGNTAKCLSLCDKAERLAGGTMSGIADIRAAAAKPRAAPAAAPKADYTPAQADAVRSVLARKGGREAYYNVLGLSKASRPSEDQIKKAYRKAALKLHPDKNRAPNADEAFKLVSQAFATLSDPEKKAFYDQTGEDEDAPPQPGMRRRRRPAGFDDEVSPEDIFNMFFGGQVPVRHRGGVHYQQRRAAPPPNQVGQLLQLAPLLLLFCLSFFSYPNGLHEPAFSLERGGRYTVERFTKSRGVTRDLRYFVPESFASRYARDPYSLARVDQSVEAEKEQALRYGCYAQREQQRRLLYQARQKRTRQARDEATERANAYELRDCEELERVFRVRT